MSIAESFVAIDTARYTSREAFSERVQRVIRQVEVDFHPARFDRVGVRYVNRLQGSMTDDLGALIHPDLLSGLSIPRGDNVTMSLSLTQSIFRVGDITLTARWGLLPAGATVDPLIEATPDPSWILDLDAAYESGGRFGVELIGAHVRSAAAVCYRFFRWAVTAEYIGRAGGST